MQKIFWNYSSNGPEKWATLCTDYYEANQKYMQSPIALEKQKITNQWNKSQLSFDYSSQKFEVQWDYHTFHFSPQTKENRVRFLGKWYVLKDFHFHLPSEHTLNGQLLPIEFHLVHFSEDGEALVIALLFEQILPDNPFLPSISLGLHESSLKVTEIDFQNILPEKLDYYVYEGSFTTPPCIGNVHWIVFSTTQNLHSSELLLFLKEIHWRDNNRPIQKQYQKRIWHT